MLISELLVKCPCCGREMKIATKRSYFIAEYGMDQKPINQGGLPMFYHCGSCNYCDVQFDKAADITVKAMIASDVYQKIWFSDDKPEAEKEYLAAIQIASDARWAADLWINYCWFLEFEGKEEEARAAREKAVEMQGYAISIDKDPSLMLQRMDCLRQLGKMDEALSMIPEIKTLVSPSENPEFVKLLIYEKKLITSGDIGPHFQSEGFQ